MERDQTMDDDEKQWELLRQQVKEMREAMLVSDAMTLRHEDRIKEHQQWLEEMERAEARHGELTVKHHEFIAQHEAMMALLDEKLNRIADLIIKGHTQNGNKNGN
jgi:hypothetical protein